MALHLGVPQSRILFQPIEGDVLDKPFIACQYMAQVDRVPGFAPL